MRRSLKYIVFAGSSVFSCALMYNTRGDSKFGTLYAAGKATKSAEILRSRPTYEFQEWNKNWDFREACYEPPKSPDRSRVPSLAERFGDEMEQKPASSAASSKATRHLLFIRHGQYVKADEDEKRVLTHNGRKQAEKTGDRLKELHLHDKKIDKIVISTMTRARETGDIIRKSLPDVPNEYCDFLREGAPCIPEPSSNWKPEYHEVFQDSARIEAAFRKYIHRAEPEQTKDSIEVYVCHANVIRYFVCRALQFPAEGWLRMSIGNCGMTWLTVKPNGTVHLRSMGDTGHLPADLMTRS